MRDHKTYLKRLFRPGEVLAVANHPAEIQMLTYEQALCCPPSNFIALNPLRKWKNNENVTACRNLLVEFDKIPLPDQLTLLHEIKMPYTTLTYSGGKSYHAVIALEEGVTFEEYKELFKLLTWIYMQDDGFLPMDDSVSAPSTFTRMPGAYRSDKGKMQELVEVRRRVTKERLIKWMARFHSKIDAFAKAQEAAHAAAKARCEAALEQGLNGMEFIKETYPTLLERLEGRLPVRGSRHNFLFHASCTLFEAHCPYETVQGRIFQAADILGVTSEPGRYNEVERILDDAHKKIFG